MNVQTMQHSEGHAELSPFLSVLHPLWGKDYSALGAASNIRVRVQRKAHSNAQGVGGMGSQRARASQASEGTACDWPGRTHGIRGPIFGETPLSWAEVVIAVNINAGVKAALKAKV